MEKEIKFSKHAERQLKERNITLKLAQETLENPQQIVKVRQNRKVAQRIYHRQGKEFLLRVVFSEQDNPEIITVYWTSKVSKYWRE